MPFGRSSQPRHRHHLCCADLAARPRAQQRHHPPRPLPSLSWPPRLQVMLGTVWTCLAAQRWCSQDTLQLQTKHWGKQCSCSCLPLCAQGFDCHPPHTPAFVCRDVYIVYEIMDTDVHQIIRSPQPLSGAQSRVARWPHAPCIAPCFFLCFQDIKNACLRLCACWLNKWF